MRKAIISLIGLLLTCLPGICREFEYTYEDQTLTYTVISEEEKTVSVSEGEEIIYGAIVPSEVHIFVLTIKSQKIRRKFAPIPKIL